MQRFDRLLTKIPEHTWGEDTTWYLHDYDNWTNPQITTAMHQENYNMTVESWREQRMYLVNSIAVLEKGGAKYAAFAKELNTALEAIKPKAPTPASSGYKAASSVTAPLKCGAVSIAFDSVGGIASVHKGSTGWTGSMGGFIYQAL